MVEELRLAVVRAQQQPDDEQRRIAQLILEELEDQEWEQSPTVMAAISEAHAEIAAGDVMDYEEYARQRRQRRS